MAIAMNIEFNSEVMANQRAASKTELKVGSYEGN